MDLPSQGEPAPSDNKKLTFQHTPHTQTNQSKSITSAIAFIELLNSTPTSSCPHLPGPGMREGPCAPDLPKLFKVASPKSAYPACLFLPVEITIKALDHISPHSLCLLTNPGASLCAPRPAPPWHAPFFGISAYSTLSFSWQASPRLASSHLNNKTCTLKYLLPQHLPLL